MQRTCLFCTYCYVLLGRHTHGFFTPLGGVRQVRARARTRVSLTVAAPRCSVRKCSRRNLLRLAGTPAGNGGNGGAAAAEDGSLGANIGLEDAGIRRAPLRITPNIQPHDKRRPKTDVIRDLATNPAFLTDESFDMFALAWAEFTDWSRRTVNRNVAGVPFEFDIRQWCSSARKWWLRMVEMDVQAKADFFRLYEQGMHDRDAWGNQAVKVDARVEDEWDNIYVECQDCFDGGRGGTNNNLQQQEQQEQQQKQQQPPRSKENAAREGAGAALPAYMSSSTGAAMSSARDRDSTLRFSSTLDLGFEAIFAGEDEEEEEGTLGEGDDADSDGQGEERDDGDEEIIDCAIRGKWYFKDNDDQPHFSPQ